jgi:hypothetical protein
MKLNFKIILLVLLQNRVNAWQWPWYRPRDCQQLLQQLNQAINKAMLRTHTYNFGYGPIRISCAANPGHFVSDERLMRKFVRNCKRSLYKISRAQNNYDLHCQTSNLPFN